MNRDSILNGNRICEDCDFLIQSLEKEIENYHRKILALTELRDLEMLGESSSALKCRNNELIDIVRQLIDADELEIKDIRILCERVSGIYINGDEVLTNIEKARREAEACENTASSLSSAADHAVFPWEASSLRGMANASRSQADSWNRIRRHWEEQRDLYDAIDYNTSTLFRDLSALNRQSSLKIDSFLLKGLSQGQYDANGSSDLLRSGAGKISIVDFTKRYLASSGFDESDIDIIYKNYYDVFLLIMQAQRYHSFELYDLLIKARKLCLKESYRSIYDDLVDHQGYTSEQAMDFLYDLYANDALESYDKSLYFPVSDPFTDIKDDLEFERYIFEKINFPIRPEEIEQVHDILVDFGITDRYSIACFLLSCRFETTTVYEGRSGEYNGEYYDSNGVRVTENYSKKDEYEFFERGVGYIQVTGFETQNQAYNYLLSAGYIGEKDDDGSYVDELAQNPWAVSAWYWANNPKVQTSENTYIPLNDYVRNVSGEDAFVFSVGLPYVCECFVNGIDTPGIDDQHHNIARGDMNWYVDSDNNLVVNTVKYATIKRFDELKNFYNLLMNEQDKYEKT